MTYFRKVFNHSSYSLLVPLFAASSITTLTTSSSPLNPSNHFITICQEEESKDTPMLNSFNTFNKINNNNNNGINKKSTDVIASAETQKLLENFVIISGSSSLELTNEICKLLGKKTCSEVTARFSDGEIFPKINESVRGLDVFIIQSCSNPVNGSIMELLLLSTAARRSDASSVTVIVPYFGYKYHRRGLPISTTLKSRFLWSSAADIAKMLEAVGVDKVISVDLQRPGQGHEACFFDTQIPVESINADETLVNYFVELGTTATTGANASSSTTGGDQMSGSGSTMIGEIENATTNTSSSDVMNSFNHTRITNNTSTRSGTSTTGGSGTGVTGPLQSPVVIISPNSQFLKKAQRFQNKLKKRMPHLEVDYAVFLHDFSDISLNNAMSSEFLGDVHGADVIIVDDLVDTAGTLSTLCKRLRKGGARRVFICASHGVFSQNSMELIDLSPVEQVVVTNSLSLPIQSSSKIIQVSIAPLIARVIETEAKCNYGTSSSNNGDQDEVNDIFVGKMNFNDVE